MKKHLYLILSIILASLILVSCGVKSAPPEIASEAEAEETPRAQAADDQTDTESGDSDQIDTACQMDSIMIDVNYDHRWTWSPDGSENTGAYIGQAKGNETFVLLNKNTGFGSFEAETKTFSFSQEGTIIGTEGKCTIKNGKGEVELMLYGKCTGGEITLEWVESQTGGSAEMLCDDGKTYGFGTFHPVQYFADFVIDEDGWGYKQSDGTDAPFFRDVSMEWTFELIGQYP